MIESALHLIAKASRANGRSDSIEAPIEDANMIRFLSQTALIVALDLMPMSAALQKCD